MIMAVDLVLAGITVTASLLSLIGTAFILLCYLILPHKQHIRHALIMNLTLADFINATNNSVSGLSVLANRRDLHDSPGCVANGFIGQLSVQAVDFSILAITIVTFYIVTSQRVINDIRLWKIILICASAWFVPIITSFIALSNGLYHPVSGNWCWIEDSPTYLRYVLTHGWRFVIIFIVTGLCIYIQIYLRRHLRAQASLNQSTLSRSPYVQLDHPSAPSIERLAKKKVRISGEEDEEEMIDRAVKMDEFQQAEAGSSQQHQNPQLATTLPMPQDNSLPTTTQSRKLNFFSTGPKRNPTTPTPRPTKQKKTSIEKTMLLNAYPVFYIVLWIPGLANRIAEATGHEVYTLQVLQASTQLIGFANAVTFGWNERIGRHLGARIRALLGGRGTERWVID